MEDKKVFKPQAVNPPIVYMWIAHFNDGTSIPEFDPFTYEENTIENILNREEELVKFGIYSIPSTLSKEINKRHDNQQYTLANPFLPKHEVNLDEFKRLIFYRRNFIHNENFHKCLKCGHEFQSSDMTDDHNPAPICPKCKSHDLYICQKCGNVYQRLKDGKSNMCECGSHLQRKVVTSNTYGRQRRERETHIGYQETIKGINKKNILKIDKDGNSELVYQK